MLSGGLDSSILTKLLYNNNSELTTFSIEFENNDNDFKSNNYQPTKDSDYIKIMNKYIKTNHIIFKYDHNDLYKSLIPCMINKDYPGMADIDGSMYIFCKSIIDKGYNICMSGECSDEIFAGYPWFYKQNLTSLNTFPWANSIDIRSNIINNDVISDTELQEYINRRYMETLNNVTYLDDESEDNKKLRNIQYLTIKWFMNTLIERTERNCGNLDVRIPFADYRIFEYVYNIPFNKKLGTVINNEPTEKYLLRKAFENELPNEIVFRKKSPFPKTYDPNYLELVEKECIRIISNKESKIHKIIDTNYILKTINKNGTNLKENFFGQLMTYPQLLAYIIQIENWINIYNIKFDF